MPDRRPDRRRSQRWSPRGQLFVDDDLRGGRLGMISNISATGMMLISDSEIPEQAAFQLRISDFPGGVSSCVLGVESIWTEAASTPGRFWTGFRIIESDPKFAQAIAAPGPGFDPW